MMSSVDHIKSQKLTAHFPFPLPKCMADEVVECFQGLFTWTFLHTSLPLVLLSQVPFQPSHFQFFFLSFFHFIISFVVKEYPILTESKNGLQGGFEYSIAWRSKHTHTKIKKGIAFRERLLELKVRKIEETWWTPFGRSKGS